MVEENDAICRRVAVGQKLAQHMSALPMATSWTHAVNDEVVEKFRERCEMGTSIHGTLSLRKRLSKKTGIAPERFVPLTPAPGSNFRLPSGYLDPALTSVYMDEESPGKATRSAPPGCEEANSRRSLATPSLEELKLSK